MTRVEFVKAMAYVSAGCGKALSPESLEVYFDCLGDLPFDVMLLAAKRVLLNHRFANFPTVAEFREAAAETVRGRVKELTSADAWELAWRAAANTDPEVEGSFARATKDLPPLVLRAMKSFGVHALCYGREPVSVVRGQFLKIYEQLAAAEKKAALLPAATRQAIKDKAPKDVPAGEALALAGWKPESPE